jgi:GldM C-terminal domain
MKGNMILIIVMVVFLKAEGQKFTLAIERPAPIAYIGLDNPLSCTVEKEPCDSVFLSTDNGTITKLSCNTYWYAPVKVADSKITVSVRKNKKAREIGSIIIRAREIPNPTALIGGINDGQISKNNLSVQQGVASALVPSIGIDVKFMVTEFQLSIVRKDSVLFSFKNVGARFSENVRQAFTLLKKGDTIIISSIYVMKPDARTVLIKPIELLIED